MKRGCTSYCYMLSRKYILAWRVHLFNENFTKGEFMAVLKNKTKRDNFFVVSKIFLQDTNLSLTERGLLATMHSLPEDWDFTIAGMGEILPDGESKIRSALDGLVGKGYVSKTQSKESDGRFGRNIIEVNEKPLAENDRQYNMNECNNNQSIYPSLEKQTDLMDGEMEFENYKKLIADNIKLDWLLEVAKRNGESEVAMVHEIYDVICDMVCYPRKQVVIKETTYPWTTVKSQFLKLRYQHIGDILNRIVDAELGIKNMSAYLISTLYSASHVGMIEAEASMHDDYLKYLRGNPY